MRNQKPKRNKVMRMTLCHTCVVNFRNSGYVVVKNGFQKEKETCDFCNVRRGLTYGIFRKK